MVCTYGRQFDFKDRLYSKVRGLYLWTFNLEAVVIQYTLQISRRSIDVLKENFRDEITKDDIILIAKLKKVYGIP